MSDPATRVRTLVMALAMLGVSWGAITVLGDRSCAAFTDRETRELAGLPVPPECVSGTVAPGSPVDRLQQQLDRPPPFPGVSP